MPAKYHSVCERCGRARPPNIADPTCSMGGYCNWEDSERCIVLDCTNYQHEGKFVGELCYPCHQFVVDGCGVHSQAFRNAVEASAFAALNHIQDDRVPLVERRVIGKQS